MNSEEPSTGYERRILAKGKMAKSVAIIGTRGYPSYYGGFETAVRKLAPYLANAGWDVTVYGRQGATVLDDPDRDSRVNSATTFGFETKSLSTLSHGFTASVAARRARPDVALVMNVANAFWLPLLNQRKIPSLINVDGIEWDRAKWGTMAKTVFYRGARATAKHGTRLVYDSRVIADRWRSEFARDGDFIPYGGDVPEQLPIEEGLEHRKYVLLVARFVPENTVPEFLEAAREISKHTDVVLVGSSNYGSEIDEAAQSLAQSSPRIRWLGHVSDDARLLSLWQHAGVYFHGHSVGGTNPALVQAMACGSPIVARDTSYNREVLTDAGGAFVSAKAESIASEVIKLIGDEGRQRRLSEFVESRAKSDYSWNQVCESYEKSLNSIIGTLR